MQASNIRRWTLTYIDKTFSNIHLDVSSDSMALSFARPPKVEKWNHPSDNNGLLTCLLSSVKLSQSPLSSLKQVGI